MLFKLVQGKIKVEGREFHGQESRRFIRRMLRRLCRVVPLSAGDNSPPLTGTLPWLILAYPER